MRSISTDLTFSHRGCRELTYLKKIINKYHTHNARAINRLLPDREFINVTITSPPYWNIKDYGCDKQIGFGQSYQSYLDDIEAVFGEIYKRTKKNGSLWLVSDTFKHDGELRLLPFDISQRLKSCGWILQDIIIWQKDRTLPWSHQGKLRNIFEYIAFYTKSSNFKYHASAVKDIADIKDYWIKYPERYSPDGKAPSRTWHFAIPKQGSWGKDNYVRHACPLPPGLIERILKLTSDKGDLILDPFAGSGSVLAMSKALGRNYIGIDLNKEYKKMFSCSVLPAITTQFNSRLNIASENALTRRKFRELILQLRSLKFPKELSRLYSTNGIPACLCIIVLRNAYQDELNIRFVFKNKKSIPRNFHNDITAIAIKAPLSKYGISASIEISEMNNIGRLIRTIKHKTLFLYKGSVFYRWHIIMSKADLKRRLQDSKNWKFSTDRFPPIISNIKLKIDTHNPGKSLEK